MTWDEWLNISAGRLKSIARRVCPKDPDDLYQELLIITWKAFERYGSKAELLIGTVIRNRVYNYYAAQKVRSIFQPFPEGFDVAFVDKTEESLLDLIIESAQGTSAYDFVYLSCYPQEDLRLFEGKLKFKWQLIYAYTGKNHNDRNRAFGLLRKKLETLYPEIFNLKLLS